MLNAIEMRQGTITKQELLGLLGTRGDAAAKIRDSQGKVWEGVFQGCFREDGTGRSFIMAMTHNGKPISFHLRTID